MAMRQPLLLVPNEYAAATANELVDAARTLSSHVRVERSVKMVPGQLNLNRFLLSIQGTDTSVEAVLGVADWLGMPESQRRALERHYRNPSTVLLGMDQDGDRIIKKLYLEFWDDVVRQVQGTSDRRSPILLNAGFKWFGDTHVTTEYTCFPLLTPDETVSRIKAIIEPISPELVDVVSDIHRCAVQKGLGATFPYIEAREKGGRLSFDINLYHADLELVDIATGIASAAALFSIPGETLDSFKQFWLCPFGHLSAGIGRDNAPFLTIYFEDRSLREIQRSPD